jgi:hypothetical protein
MKTKRRGSDPLELVIGACGTSWINKIDAKYLDINGVWW